MFAFSFFLIVLCFGSNPVWSDTESTVTSSPPVEGVVHRWCLNNSGEKYKFPSVPAHCCNEASKCDRFINGGDTVDGLYNNGTVTKRHCDCDKVFANCALDNSESFQKLQVKLMLFREYCFQKNESCTNNASGCTENGFVILGSILHTSIIDLPRPANVKPTLLP